MKRNWKILVFAAALFFTAAACTIDLAGWRFWDKSGTEVPVPDLATFTPIPSKPPTSQETEEAPAAPTAAPTTAPDQTASGPSTTAVNASCLPGHWQINHDSVLNYLSQSLAGVGTTGFTPKSSGGNIQMQIVPGNIFMQAEQFTVNLGVNLGAAADVSAISASVDSNASANYLATDHQIALTDILYTAAGTVTSQTGTLALNLNDLLSLAQSLGFAQDVPNPVTSRYLNYTCSGDQLTIVVNPYASVVFDRIVE